MNSKDRYDFNEETLAALRLDEDPVRTISEKLGVKEMGPADHIRTKHEIKAYVESGSKVAADELIRHAHARRDNERTQRVSENNSLGRSISRGG